MPRFSSFLVCGALAAMLAGASPAQAQSATLFFGYVGQLEGEFRYSGVFGQADLTSGVSQTVSVGDVTFSPNSGSTGGNATLSLFGQATLATPDGNFDTVNLIQSVTSTFEYQPGSTTSGILATFPIGDTYTFTNGATVTFTGDPRRSLVTATPGTTSAPVPVRFNLLYTAASAPEPGAATLILGGGLPIVGAARLRARRRRTPQS